MYIDGDLFISDKYRLSDYIRLNIDINSPANKYFK